MSGVQNQLLSLCRLYPITHAANSLDIPGTPSLNGVPLCYISLGLLSQPRQSLLCIIMALVLCPQ